MVFALRPVWEAHCVNNSEERKIANACKGFAEGIPMWKEHKGFAKGVQKEKPLVIRNKDAKNINNNVAFALRPVWEAHCVNNSEERKIANAHKGFAEGVQKGKPLVVRVKSFDSLSRSNSCLVINNKLLLEVQS